MPVDYPPERHLLRDLRFTFEHDPSHTRSRAWMPVVPELCTDHDGARAGALATLVDVIGGGLAAGAAAPGWIATADLTLAVVAAARPGSTVEARGQVLRAGRTTVVIEVALVDEREHDVGIATMSFAVLPRRDTNPVADDLHESPPTMATAASRMAGPLLDQLGLDVVDAARGVVETPVIDWSLNSMGAMQGGVVATVADAAAEAALRAATGRPLVVSDMYVTYLGFGRVGPVRSQVDVLGRAAGHGAARVELFDAGAENRQMTVVHAVASEAPA
jgi:uncharacterized protein (TIGR00369 family)